MLSGRVVVAVSVGGSTPIGVVEVPRGLEGSKGDEDMVPSTLNACI